MTEKELKKLNRYQLLELLILQTKRADELERQLEAAEQQLNERDIHIMTLGSIADASMQLNDVFTSAQKAADMYVENAQRKAADIEERARAKAYAIVKEAESRALEVLKKSLSTR